MPTKTFSSRADERDLAYAEAITREKFGMSFGQYCGSVLLNAVRQGVDLPAPVSKEDAKRFEAFETIRSFSQRKHDPAIGNLSDEQIRELIGSRYE